MIPGSYSHILEPTSTELLNLLSDRWPVNQLVACIPFASNAVTNSFCLMFHPGIKPMTLPSGPDLNIPQISRYPVEVHPLPKSRLFTSQHHYDRSNCLFDINGGTWLTQDLALPKRHLRNTNLPTAHHALSVCGMRVHPRTDQPPSPLRDAPTRAPSRGRSQSRGRARNTTSAPVIKSLATAEDIVSPRPLSS